MVESPKIFRSNLKRFLDCNLEVRQKKQVPKSQLRPTRKVGDKDSLSRRPATVRETRLCVWLPEAAEEPEVPEQKDMEEEYCLIPCNSIGGLTVAYHSFRVPLVPLNVLVALLLGPLIDVGVVSAVCRGHSLPVANYSSSRSLARN